MDLSKYSIGIGDRFAHQALAQLRAVEDALKYGVAITPVWNKSYREHKTIGSVPEETRIQADNAVKILKWERPYFVDADHINLDNVDFFIEHSDFFTIDVADFIGTVISEKQLEHFFSWSEAYFGEFKIPGITTTFKITKPFLDELAGKYLGAAGEAYKIYSHILRTKGEANFVTEISIDEVDIAQSPIELFFILGMLRNIPLHTFAPRFIGEFLKGIDYVGDPIQFSKELDEIFYVLDYAKKEFDLPRELKLSIHTGSDKFRLYPIINMLLKKHDQGIHLKTAGTTWLEELNGLSISGEYGLSMAKEIYTQAFNRFDELSGPYQNVINIDYNKLPSPAEVNVWSIEKFSNSLTNNSENKDYNLNFRQLLHIGYKIAAEMGTVFKDALDENKEVVGRYVQNNIFDRHIKPLFID